MNFRPNFTMTKDENGQPIAEKEKKYESVINYMAKDLITFKPDQDINEVINTMIENEISGAPVLDEKGNLIGMITEKDCLRVIVDVAYHNQMLSNSKVADYMSTELKTVSAESDVLDVADAFLKTMVRRFPVVDKGKLIGQVSRRDILKAAKKIESTTW
ncbi:MAG: CBS domain-containing protein [Candidatus Cyclobacteriaceae bacterium M3_2C_046]